MISLPTLQGRFTGITSRLFGGQAITIRIKLNGIAVHINQSVFSRTTLIFRIRFDILCHESCQFDMETILRKVTIFVKNLFSEVDKDFLLFVELLNIFAAELFKIFHTLGGITDEPNRNTQTICMGDSTTPGNLCCYLDLSNR